MKPERKLKYLGEYISQLVDSRISDALGKTNKFTTAEFKQPFNRWLESNVDKKKSKGEKRSNEQKKTYCSYCGRVYDHYLEKTKDHIVPVSKFGKNVKENRVHACKECNQWKDNKTLEDWQKELRALVRKNKVKQPYDNMLVGRMIGNISRIIEEIKQNSKRISDYKI